MMVITCWWWWRRAGDVQGLSFCMPSLQSDKGPVAAVVRLEWDEGGRKLGKRHS